MRRAIISKRVDGVIAALDRGASPFRDDVMDAKPSPSPEEPPVKVSLALAVVDRWDWDMPQHLTDRLARAMAENPDVSPENAFGALPPLIMSAEGRALAILALQRGLRVAASVDSMRAFAIDLANVAFYDCHNGRPNGGARAGCAGLMEALLTLPCAAEAARALSSAPEIDPSAQPLVTTARVLAVNPEIADVIAFRALSLRDARQIVSIAAANINDEEWLSELPPMGTPGQPLTVQDVLPRTCVRLEQAELQSVVRAAELSLVDASATSSTSSQAGQRAPAGADSTSGEASLAQGHAPGSRAGGARKPRRI
ncbi:hypothetical protein LA345_13335 [Burkholderia vietnamiensis]|nr:hypothetical protein [Burkholderia vietnamiensis]